MKKLSKKMMISLLTFALVFIALGVSTFAWFTLADSASLNDLEINVSLGEGLDISLDGTNYQSNLTKEDIARKIGNIKLTDCTSTDGISIKDIKGGYDSALYSCSNLTSLSRRTYPDRRACVCRNCSCACSCCLSNLYESTELA